MSTKLKERIILLIWLCLHLVLSVQLFPFAKTLSQLNSISSIPDLIPFIHLNTFTRLIGSALDKLSLGTMLIQSIQPLEFFSLILDLLLIFALIEDKKIIKCAKIQFASSFLVQSISLLVFAFIVKTQNTHLGLLGLNFIGYLSFGWMGLRITLPLTCLFRKV